MSKVSICIILVDYDTIPSPSQESIVLHQLSANQLQALFPPIFDEFFVTGPNGKHQCLVTPLAGASLADIQDGTKSFIFELPVAHVIAAQLILAVCSLHSEGIVHACKLPRINT
jgi:hypothetical protein